jgi:hypothetical protein
VLCCAPFRLLPRSCHHPSRSTLPASTHQSPTQHLISSHAISSPCQK